MFLELKISHPSQLSCKWLGIDNLGDDKLFNHLDMVVVQVSRVVQVQNNVYVLCISNSDLRVL